MYRSSFVLCDHRFENSNFKLPIDSNSATTVYIYPKWHASVDINILQLKGFERIELTIGFYFTHRILHN